jgi:hypothetical protein
MTSIYLSLICWSPLEQWTNSLCCGGGLGRGRRHWLLVGVGEGWSHWNYCAAYVPACSILVEILQCVPRLFTSPIPHSVLVGPYIPSRDRRGSIKNKKSVFLRCHAIMQAFLRLLPSILFQLGVVSYIHYTRQDDSLACANWCNTDT